MLVTLNRVSYRYEDSPEQALAPVTAALPPGWTGVVGSNGCGKTTLLRLICGELEPTSGQVTPRTYSVYCAQETELEPPAAAELIADFSSRALRIRAVLGIEDEWVSRYDRLSEGERKRLQVAVALWQDPEVLALDEPTNHVDSLCRERIIEALAGFGGVGLLVSHDREMLDALTSQCLFMSQGTSVLRPGNYSKGHQQQAIEQLAATRQRKDAKRELARLQTVKAERVHEAARADARLSKRNIPKGDKDAKAKIDLAVFTSQDGKAGRLSSQMDSRLAAAQRRLDDSRVDKSYDADVWFDTEPSRRRLVLEMEEGCLPFGESGGGQGWLQIPKLMVSPTDHIAVTGPNGAGKTTLVEALCRVVPSGLRLLYLPQELSTNERQRQLSELKQLPPVSRGRVLSIVAQLNSDPDRLLGGRLASPGETRKLMLALGILERPEVIIMDEPTNHLDLGSIEALEAMLSACPCALLLVSHDERFLGATTAIRWSIEPGVDGSRLRVGVV
ncbi:MAG: ATP-binding cassette domain-containing protein [Coriobacteriia bacterium]|nr:ATP-binding cassette domain-containing protein [Coriobacteriia bacterium]